MPKVVVSSKSFCLKQQKKNLHFQAIDKKRTKNWSTHFFLMFSLKNNLGLTGTGVSCEGDMKIQARIMLATSLTYIIIQVCFFLFFVLYLVRFVNLCQAIAWVFTDRSKKIQIDQQEEFALVRASL
jgi:hypothetical protein